MPNIKDTVNVMGFGKGTITDIIEDEMNLPFVVQFEIEELGNLRFSEESFEEVPEEG